MKPHFCLGYLEWGASDGSDVTERDFPEEYEYCKRSRRLLEVSGGLIAMVVTNNRYFDQNSYEFDSPVIKEAKVSYINIPLTPTHYNYELRQYELEYDDNMLISMHGVTGSSEDYVGVT